MTATEFNHKLMSFQVSLEHFARKLTTNQEDANDLVQETYLKALTFKDKYVHHTNFKAWLFTIMKNIFSNQTSKYGQGICIGRTALRKEKNRKAG